MINPNLRDGNCVKNVPEKHILPYINIYVLFQLAHVEVKLRNIMS